MVKTEKTKKSKKVVSAVLAVALLSAGGVATYAGFTDQASSAISVTAGTIDLQLGTTKSFPISLGLMKPGDTVVKTIVVNNKGTLPLNYTATTVGATSGQLASALNVTVTSGATSVMPVKKLNAMTTPSRLLSATNGTETLTLTIEWPNGTAAVDNPLQGKPGDTVLTFNATQ